MSFPSLDFAVEADFWTARPALGHLHGFARARRPLRTRRPWRAEEELRLAAVLAELLGCLGAAGVGAGVGAG